MRLAQQKNPASGKDFSLGYQWDLDPGSRVLVLRDAGTQPPKPVMPQMSGENDGGLSPVMMAIGWTAAVVAVVSMFVHVTHWNARK